jgi:TPR repeat protein
LLKASGASEEALVWFHKAGEQGNFFAQVELGNRYQTGVDDHQVFKWFRLTAEQGHSLTQYHLGLMHPGRLSGSHPLASLFRRARPPARHRGSA